MLFRGWDNEYSVFVFLLHLLQLIKSNAVSIIIYPSLPASNKPSAQLYDPIQIIILISGIHQNNQIPFISQETSVISLSNHAEYFLLMQ